MTDKPKLDKSASDPMPGMEQPSPAIDLPDDPLKTVKSDRHRINASQDHELDEWAATLGVTAAELRKAVEDVGPMAEDVRKHLGK